MKFCEGPLTIPEPKTDPLPMGSVFHLFIKDYYNLDS